MYLFLFSLSLKCLNVLKDAVPPVPTIYEFTCLKKCEIKKIRIKTSKPALYSTPFILSQKQLFTLFTYFSCFKLN